jgi:hypothetical protein
MDKETLIGFCVLMFLSFILRSAHPLVVSDFQSKKMRCSGLSRIGSIAFFWTIHRCKKAIRKTRFVINQLRDWIAERTYNRVSQRRD